MDAGTGRGGAGASGMEEISACWLAPAAAAGGGGGIAITVAPPALGLEEEGPGDPFAPAAPGSGGVYVP